MRIGEGTSGSAGKVFATGSGGGATLATGCRSGTGSGRGGATKSTADALLWRKIGATVGISRGMTTSNMTSVTRMPYPTNNEPLRFSALSSYDAKSPLGAGSTALEI